MKLIHPFCHFDAGEIFASKSAMKIQSLSSFSRRFLLRRNDNTLRLKCLETIIELLLVAELRKKTFVKVLNFDKGLSYSLEFGI